MEDSKPTIFTCLCSGHVKVFTFISSSRDFWFSRHSYGMRLRNWIVCEWEWGIDKDRYTCLEAKKLNLWWKHKCVEFCFFSICLWVPAMVLLNFWVWKSPSVALLLFSVPCVCWTPFLWEPLVINYSYMIRPLKITIRKCESMKRDGFYFGKVPKSMNFLFFLFWAKWSGLFSLIANGCIAFSSPLRLGYVFLFFPDVQPFALVHSVELASQPTDFGQGCSLETWVV
jgi:hypothetical protein